MWKAQKSGFPVALPKLGGYKWNEPGENPRSWGDPWDPGILWEHSSHPHVHPPHPIQIFWMGRKRSWAQKGIFGPGKGIRCWLLCKYYPLWREQVCVWAGSDPLCSQFEAHHELFCVPAIGNMISLQPIAKGQLRWRAGKGVGMQMPMATASCPAGKSLFSAITQPSHQPSPRAAAGWGGQGHLDITREVLSAMHHPSSLLHGVWEAEIWALFLPGKALFFPFLHVQ